MNEQPSRNTTDGESNNPKEAKNCAQTSASKPSFGASSMAKPIPRETAQEAEHQVTPRKTSKAPYAPAPASDDTDPPPRAAKGDDDLMSKPQIPPRANGHKLQQ